MTEWRDTVGYQGYEVSSMGEVRNKLTGRILRGWIRPSGHRSVCLAGGRQVQVHHLVLTAFVSHRPDGMECRHLDSNPDNNVLQNLQWGTRKENIADFKALTGRYAPARLTDEQAQQIREEFTGKYGEQRKLAQKFGVSLNIVNRIVRGKTYAAANSVSG
jgi:hypothetical protein